MVSLTLTATTVVTSLRSAIAVVTAVLAVILSKSIACHAERVEVGGFGHGRRLTRSRRGGRGGRCRGRSTRRYRISRQVGLVLIKIVLLA